MGPWGTRMLEALQQQTAMALKKNVPEQRVKRLMQGTLTALHGEYMALILRNTSGTYDMAIECTHGAFPEYRPLVQDLPESNLMPPVVGYAVSRQRGYYPGRASGHR